MSSPTESGDQAPLPAVIVEPTSGAGARHSVIWLHGLGADGNDFPPIVAEIGVRPEHGVRWVFPHAPSIPVTLNGGMVMPAWYDIRGEDFNQRPDEDGIRLSAARVERLIRAENERGVPTERIVLAGFSQGGAIALFSALRLAEPLLGVVALSTYLLLPDAVAAERSPANAGVPIFQAHGTHDPMVGHERGIQSRKALEELGYEIEWHEYPMMHQVCLEEIQALGVWFEARFGSTVA